jgi:hypothetical protein
LDFVILSILFGVFIFVLFLLRDGSVEIAGSLTCVEIRFLVVERADMLAVGLERLLPVLLMALVVLTAVTVVFLAVGIGTLRFFTVGRAAVLDDS